MFGGNVLTATDIYVRANVAKDGINIGDPSKVADLTEAIVRKAEAVIKRKLEVWLPISSRYLVIFLQGHS